MAITMRSIVRAFSLFSFSSLAKSGNLPGPGGSAWQNSQCSPSAALKTRMILITSGRAISFGSTFRFFGGSFICAKAGAAEASSRTSGAASATRRAGNDIRVILRVGNEVPESVSQQGSRGNSTVEGGAPTPCRTLRRYDGRAGRTRPTAAAFRPASGARQQAGRRCQARRPGDRRGRVVGTAVRGVRAPDGPAGQAAVEAASRSLTLLSAARSGRPLAPQVEGLHLIVEVRAI